MTERTYQGVTSEFYWYELSKIKRELQYHVAQIDMIIKTIETREKEQADYVTHLLSKIEALQADNAALRKD